MWDHMTFGVTSMWSNPYMLIFWLVLFIAAVVLGIVIARTLPQQREDHDDTHTLHHH